MLNIDLQRTGKSFYGATLASHSRQRKQSTLRNRHHARRLSEMARETTNQLGQRNILSVRDEESLASRGGIVYATHKKVHQIIDADKRPLAPNRAERQGPPAIDETH
ncbi:MAG: hypothetical protein FJ170_02070 [Gammaproteobacteria bacterium]|nr:hypothetical protein [Gammaproteobacteria bacterium]